jgi:pimeloyl-ACP methyl ester carboxylesterase
MPTKKKAITLLHALWSTASCFQEAKQKLAANLPKDVEIISLTEPETSSKSIAQQAVRLKEALLARSMDRANYELILLGHSQGGLRGYQFYQEFGEQFDIKGLITMGTPWEGAPTAKITKETTNAYLNSLVVHYCLKGGEYFWPRARPLTPEVIDMAFDKYLPTHEPGVQDLVPNSAFLRNVATSLEDNQLPILAIAGSNSNVKEVLLDDATYMRYIRRVPAGILNAAYAYIIAKQMWGKHDMAVPLASQLAQNTRKGTSFESHTVLDSIHGLPPDAVYDFLLVIGVSLSKITLPKDKVLYNHPDVLEKALGFIRRHFELS